MNEHPSRGDFIGILATFAMSAGCETLVGAASSMLVAHAPGIAYVPGYQTIVDVQHRRHNERRANLNR